MRLESARAVCNVMLLRAALTLALLVAPLRAQLPVRVILETALGVIEVEVDQARAPLTAENFLRYVDFGHYNRGRFHRTVKPDNQPNNEIRIEVIQGGVDPAKVKLGFDPIRLERTNATGLKHRDGTISMARTGPDTARSDFFICINDQPSLDFGGMRNPDGQGFAAFGKVVRGMDIVKRIQQAPAAEQRLTPAVEIRKAYRSRDNVR
jgi:peptidyl-prolyl cis-trans isomerase A (cyclophilin A)